MHRHSSNLHIKNIVFLTEYFIYLKFVWEFKQ